MVRQTASRATHRLLESIVTGMVFLAAAPAAAININVNSAADLALGGGGSCPGTCTLRAAVQTANATAGVDNINLNGITYALTITGTGEDAAATGDLDITESVNILVGSGAATVDGGSIDRVFHIVAGSVSMDHVVVTHGSVTDSPGAGVLIEGAAALNFSNGTVTQNTGGGTTSSGGGIAVGTESSGNASLILSTSVVTSNAASSTGGGIWVGPSSQATISNTTIADNAAANGGGIFVRAGAANVTQITGSTITENTATGNGGGVYNGVCGVMVLRNTTVDGNVALGSGGGILNDISYICQSKVTLNNATVAYNAAGGGGTGDGGGILSNGSGFLVAISMVGNSLIAWNFDLDTTNTGYVPDCGGRFDSKGHNLIQDQTGCTIVGDTTGNRPNFSNPNIGLLRNHGGVTNTIALYVGSDAIDKGNAFGGAGTFACEATDQRGTTRPIGAFCDIGAFEAPVCGNGITQAPEDCDGGASCDAACRFADPSPLHNEPKSAPKTSGNLVTAYAQCVAGNLHTLTPPSPSQTACAAVRSDAGCGFATSGTPITGTYSIEPLTTSGDVRVKVELRDLESACNAEVLTVYASFRETVQNCPSSGGGGIGSCTVTEGLTQNLQIGTCTVASGNCTVNVDLSSVPSLPQVTKGRRTGIEIQDLTVKRGALVSFVPGILIP